jgi:hypothetical protein
MNILASLRQSFRDLLGITVENRHERPDMQQVESAIVISRLFQGDALRQQLDHEIETGGGVRRFRIDDNSRDLGRL